MQNSIDIAHPLAYGSWGHDVASLQIALTAAGASPVVQVDGRYGVKTRAAVASYQRAHGLFVTGDADVATLASLVELDGAGEARRLGERALAVALAELAAGVAETVGTSNRGPRIDEYMRPTGVYGAWCAGFESWCRRAVLRPGEPNPLGYNANVHGLWSAARAAGLSRPREWWPRPGDLGIYMRGSSDPRLGGEGHVGRVEVSPADHGGYRTIDGNVGDRVARTVRTTADDDLVGWVEVP